MIYVNVGKKIKELRKIRNLTGVELADRAFISQSYLSDIERDKTKPSLDTLFTICNVLDISLAAFFSDSFEVDINEQLKLMDLLSTDTKNLVELINKLPKNEKNALMTYLNERLKNM
ncbi:helix-turn-helix transcriptional regulator [Heyndrickxia oleronia]